MGPSINMYNNLVSENGIDIWHMFKQNSPGCIFLPDLQKYSLLCTYLGDNVDHLTSDDFYACDSHSEMVTKVKEWVPEGTTFNICNIDHHHDTGYNNDRDCEWDSITSNPGCGNWVSVLKRQYGENFMSYVWLANENSDMTFLNNVTSKFSIYHSTTDIYELSALHFDKVFLCCSSQWIPPDYRHLFESLKFLLEKIINK